MTDPDKSANVHECFTFIWLYNDFSGEVTWLAFRFELHAGIPPRVAERTTYRIYRSSLHALLVVGVLVMLAGDRIEWGELRDGLSLAYLAILVHSPVVARYRTPPRNCRSHAELKQQN